MDIKVSVDIDGAEVALTLNDCMENPPKDVIEKAVSELAVNALNLLHDAGAVEYETSQTHG
jgi:hypothetical protein